MNLQVLPQFRVIDESDDWIVVDKPAPLIVHPANRQSEPTLLGGLEQLLTYELQTGGALGIITRLDRETSGLVLISKHKEAARELGWIFERREAHKEYLAIVIGWPLVDEWSCSERIIRAGELGPSEIWVRQLTSEQGKDCRTHFKVESRFEREEGKFAQVRCFPETGRMHQIRVHLAYEGFPIVGDKLYSRNGEEYLEWMASGWTPELKKRLILPRHALHAAVLEISWKGKNHRWEAELGKDLKGFSRGKEIEASDEVVIWNRAD